MTPEQQRIAIAKVCGWKVEQLASGWLWTHLNYSPQLNTGCPDYLNDLNAMHEAEKVLKKSPLLWGQYCNTLGLLCGGARDDDGGIFVSHKEAIDATAAQRAEAFLRTLNLWKP